MHNRPSMLLVYKVLMSKVKSLLVPPKHFACQSFRLFVHAISVQYNC